MYWRVAGKLFSTHTGFFPTALQLFLLLRSEKIKEITSPVYKLLFFDFSILLRNSGVTPI
jgi:hypothetical protein